MASTPTTNPQSGGNSSSQNTSPGVGNPTPPKMKNSSGAVRLKHWARGSTQKILERGNYSLGPLKATFTEVAEFIGACDDVLHGKSEYEALKISIDKTREMLDRYNSGTTPPAIIATIEGLRKDIDKELRIAKVKLNRDGMGRLREAVNDIDDMAKTYDRIRDHLQRVSEKMSTSVEEIRDAFATKARLDGLKPVISASYNSGKADELKRGPCAEGTRTDVLNQILDWIDISHPGSVYWINGMAGTGKTTIAYSLCEVLAASDRLAANFFCSRLLPDCRDVDRIIPSIAYQLARSFPSFLPALSEALEKDPGTLEKNLDQQFNTLIVQPLRSMGDTFSESLVVVIDALDECENKNSIGQFLNVLLTKSKGLSVKFVISSRPEPAIRDEMTKTDQPKSRMILQELDQRAVQADIKTYLSAALAQMQPSEDDIARLVERSGVLFIYAATIVRYISYNNFKGNSRARLKNVLNASGGADKKYKAVDDLYTTVVRGALDNSELKDSDAEDIKQVLWTVVCAREPLTVGGLSGLLGMNDIKRVHAALRPLGSVLLVSGTNEIVTALHASFPDYMLDPSRSGNYYCDQRIQNQTLALRCFNCFRSMSPQFNICGLESSFIPDDLVAGLEERVERAITTELFYAARFWVVHLSSAIASPRLIQELEEFLSVRLLLWMEVMNLKRHTSVMAEAVRLLEKWDTELSEDLRALIHDAWRFTTTFTSGPASKSTPHIYTSMLPFWPKSSPIGRSYTGRTQGMTRISGTAIGRRQHALLATWHFSNSTFSPTFSPNGKQIAVGIGFDILLLNASTGDRILPPLTGHSGLVLSVQFSPDGRRIVSGSMDKTIYVWNTETGETVLGPLEKHTGEIWSVAFSPDGSRIASGSGDKSVFICDASSGELICDQRGEYNGEIRVVKYSPDGRYIFSLGGILGIIAWDSTTGQMLKTLCQDDANSSIESIDISPDGTYIASGSETNGVFIWNIETGQVALGPLAAPSHSPSSRSVSFSHDGSRVASGSRDGTISMWDTRTGDLVLGPLDGHTARVKSIKFSPDSAYMLSGSDDQTLHLWDTRSVQTVPSPLQGSTGAIKLIRVSPDGTRIVSSSQYGNVCVWDVASGDLVATTPADMQSDIKQPISEGDDVFTEVLQIGFTPDGQRVLVNTSSGPFAFEATSGSLCSPNVGPISYIRFFPLTIIASFVTLGGLFSLVLAVNSDNIAAVSSITPYLVYNPVAELLALAIEGLTMDFGLQTPVNPLNALITQAILFMLVGVLIFGGSTSGPVDVYSPHISCIEYSPDGTRIVSGSDDGIIRVHDTRTNRLTLVIHIRLPLANGKISRITSVSFSSDGNRIISQSGGRKCQMHWAHGGKLLVDLNDAEWSEAIGISPDGTRIVTSSIGHIALVDLGSQKRRELMLELPPTYGTHSCPSHRNIFAFTPDGSRIVFVFGGSSIHVWSAYTGELLFQPIRISASEVKSMTFSPDGKHIITGSDDGTIYRANTQSMLQKSPENKLRAWDWRMDKDGWVVGDQSQLFIWVPPSLQPSLVWPGVEKLLSRKGQFQLDFQDAYIGKLWVECYRPE